MRGRWTKGCSRCICTPTFYAPPQNFEAWYCPTGFFGMKLVLIFPKFSALPHSAPALFRPVRRLWLYLYCVSFIKHHILLEYNLYTRRSARVTFWSNIAARTIHRRSLFDCSLSCIRCWKANMAIVVGGKIMPYST